YYNSEEGNSDSGVKIFNLATAQLEMILATDYEVFEFSPDERRFAVVEKDFSTVQIFDLIAQKVLHRLSTPTRGFWRPAFSPDGKLLAAGLGDSSVLIWDVASGQRKHLLMGDGQSAVWVAFSSDCKTLATST